jgi:competence protein ComEC
MPFVVWHFQNLTLVGFLANLVAVPIMGLLTTPLALLGFALGTLLPWGVTLKPAAVTIEWVNSVASTMAQWPMAQNFVPQEFTIVVLVMVLALLTLIYLRRWLWLTGAGAVATALLLWLNQHDFTPDVVSLDGGEIVLIKPAKGEVYLARTSKNEESKLLLKHYVQHRNWKIIKKRPEAVCDLEGCLFDIAGKKVLVPEVGIAPTADDCRTADAIVTDPSVTVAGCKEAVWHKSGRVAEVSF